MEKDRVKSLYVLLLLLLLLLLNIMLERSLVYNVKEGRYMAITTPYCNDLYH